MINLIPFLIYVAVTTFTPGPNNIMAMTNAVRYGFNKVTGFLFGIVSGFFVVLSLCGFLNLWLVNLSPKLTIVLDILGAAYMIYLAIHIVLSDPSKENTGKLTSNTYWAGFAMQFVNVKVILYGITVYSLYIIHSYKNPFSIVLFALMMSGVGLTAVLSWALGGHLFRDLFNKYGKIFNLVMGALLVYTAVAGLVKAF